MTYIEVFWRIHPYIRLTLELPLHHYLRVQFIKKLFSCSAHELKWLRRSAGSSLKKMALIYCLVGFLSTENLLNKRHQSIKWKRFSAQRIYMQKSVTKTPLVAPPQSCPLSVDVFVSTTWPLLSSCLQMSNIWPRLPSWGASFGLCENLNRLCPLRHFAKIGFSAICIF